MSLADFEIHLNHPAPAFRCYACGDASEELAFLARVKNRLNPPATDEDIAELDALLGGQFDDAREFYKRHNGLLLYEDTRSDAAGLELFPIGEWRYRSEGMREQFAEMGFEESDDPDGLLKGIAFGEICHSANYFTFQTTGPHSGTIFYISHDDWQNEPIAHSFSDFLALIVRDPAEFLYDAGCYTRYSDGKSDIQWIPKEYISDCTHTGI